MEVTRSGFARILPRPGFADGRVGLEWQIDERRPAAGMAHTFHQLAKVGSGLGH